MIKLNRSTYYALWMALGISVSNILPNTAMAADYPEPGDFSRGAQLWVENCNRCHNYRDPKELRDDQWITTLFHMRVRAGLTGQETRDLITFMQESNN